MGVYKVFPEIGRRDIVGFRSIINAIAEKASDSILDFSETYRIDVLPLRLLSNFRIFADGQIAECLVPFKSFNDENEIEDYIIEGDSLLI